MRHKFSGKKLNRNTNQRKNLFRNLLTALFLKEEIKTTLVKAKLVKKMADSLISKARKGTLSVRRQLWAFLPNKAVVNKLIDQIAPGFDGQTHGGGYTRLVRLSQRRGDNAVIAKVELIKKQKKEKKAAEKAVK